MNTRNLSELQATALTIGYLNRKSGKHKMNIRYALAGAALHRLGWLGPVDVTPSDLKEAYYGFQKQLFVRNYRFLPGEIGADAYHAAAASICKCFKRLEARGLVKRRSNGIWLTPTGLEMAAQLISPQEQG